MLISLYNMSHMTLLLQLIGKAFSSWTPMFIVFRNKQARKKTMLVNGGDKAMFSAFWFGNTLFWQTLCHVFACMLVQ